MNTAPKIAVIGLGEDGIAIAAALKAAGADVIGFESGRLKHPPVELAPTARDAAAVADIVLSINSPSTALRVAEDISPVLKPGALFADLNFGTPNMKRRLAKVIGEGAFIDLAVMHKVPGAAAGTPMAAAGAEAEQLVATLGTYGIHVDFVSQTPGDAAARKLMRWFAAEGLAALMTDYLWAAKSLGIADWAIDDARQAFAASSPETLQAYLDDTGKHAKRHTVELTDMLEMLAESGHESTMANAIGLTMSHVMHGRKVPFADLSDD